MENLSTAISSAELALELELDLLQPDHLQGAQKRLEEPSPQELQELESALDFSELDAMIESARKKTFRETVRSLTASNVPAMPVYVVQENLAIWERAQCACGAASTAIFLHYKEKSVSGKSIIWKKVFAIDDKKPLRNVLATRQVLGCEHCLNACPAEMEDIANAFK